MNENSVIELPDEIKMDLTTTAQWGKFLSILGFIIIGVIVLVAGALLFSGGPGTIQGFSTVTFIVTYLIVAVIYFFPTWYLFNYSIQVKRAITEDDQDKLVRAFQNLRRLFVYFGIITIVTVVFYLLAIIAVATGGIIGSAMQA